MKRPVYIIVFFYLVKSVLLKGTFYFSVKQWRHMTLLLRVTENASKHLK
jgi:hypothetical protein